MNNCPSLNKLFTRLYKLNLDFIYLRCILLDFHFLAYLAICDYYSRWKIKDYLSIGTINN